jgi:hypothetical protein
MELHIFRPSRGEFLVVFEQDTVNHLFFQKIIMLRMVAPAVQAFPTHICLANLH